VLAETWAARPDFSVHDPVVYMLRAASKRRHLTDDQRAMIAEEEREWLAKKGKERQKEQGYRGGEGGRGNKKTLGDTESPRVYDRTRKSEFKPLASTTSASAR